MEIKIENLKKIYGQNTVINIPELTLHNGELVGLCLLYTSDAADEL